VCFRRCVYRVRSLRLGDLLFPRNA
jgi:hypothetical protein